MMRIAIFNKVILLIITIGLGAGFGISCREVAIPKPTGYFRIDLPEKNYTLFDQGKDIKNHMPFTFEYPEYGRLNLQMDDEGDPGWFNIEFPEFKAKIYLTYKSVSNSFDTLIGETYKMNVVNHISKAEAIKEELINYPEHRVYGILYDLKGNTASACQFYVIDSINNYLRGSLYFAAEPNADSLAPVINFLRDDILHLIETIKWKEK
jgi:gliding motility-associated lipoprotein GldD